MPPRARLRGRVHSLERDRAAVRHHYDVGNDFYAAQEAKLERICRKLRLRPGERLLDIGCGWGGLVTACATTVRWPAGRSTRSSASGWSNTSRTSASATPAPCGCGWDGWRQPVRAIEVVGEARYRVWRIF